MTRDSRACTTYYWENLVLLVVLVLESKALYFKVKFYNNREILRTCQDILPFGAMFLAFLPVCSVVSLVLRCWVGVLHSYSPFSVSTVLTISSVPNSVILNLRLLPKIKTKFNDVHEGRCGNDRLRQGNFRRQSSPPFHTSLSKFSSFWVAVFCWVLGRLKPNLGILKKSVCSFWLWGPCGLLLLIQQYKNSYPVPKVWNRAMFIWLSRKSRQGLGISRGKACEIVLIKDYLPGRVAIPSFQSKAPNGSSPSSAVFFSMGAFFALLLALFAVSLAGTGLSSAVFPDKGWLDSFAFSSEVAKLGEEELPSGNGSDLMTRFSAIKETRRNQLLRTISIWSAKGSAAVHHFVFTKRYCICSNSCEVCLKGFVFALRYLLLP